MVKQRVEGFDLTFDSEWAHRLEQKEHWEFYWHQASLIEAHTTREYRLVEIGVGSGFLQNYLQSRRRNIVSVDIDQSKQPDFVCDASQFDFSTLSPDCFLAFEIFEHIPFPLLERTVANIASAKPIKIIFSVPESIRYLAWGKLKLPKLNMLHLNMRIPKRKVVTPNHYWELSYLGKTEGGVLEGNHRGLVSKGDLLTLFERHGFAVENVASVGRIKFFVASRVSE